MCYSYVSFENKYSYNNQDKCYCGDTYYQYSNASLAPNMIMFVDIAHVGIKRREEYRSKK